jgi:predicted nucleic-acid-binding protein
VAVTVPIAIDTNILVRLATADAKAQHAAAESLVMKHAVLIVSTVLLETEWVLRSRYGYGTNQFAAFAEWLLGNPSVTFEAPAAVRQALDWHREGFDFADALHLATANGQPFASFDAALAKRARRHGLTVLRPPFEPR